MTFKILYWNGEEVTRYMMNQPVMKGYSFKGIFCRRKDHQTQKIRYYLYTDDTETLLMAAEKQSDIHANYIISMNANQLTKLSKLYLGTCKHEKNHTFISVSWHPQISDSKRIMAYLTRRESLSGGKKISNDEVLIPNPGTAVLLDSGKSIDSIPKQSFWIINGSTEMVKDDENNTTVAANILKYQNIECLRFYQIHEDEFMFIISYPLSAYQGFSMALSYIE